MYLWWSLCTLYSLACQVNDRRCLMSLFLCLCNDFQALINSCLLILHGRSGPRSVSDCNRFYTELFSWAGPLHSCRMRLWMHACGLIDFCCLTSTAARRPIRDKWERGDRRVKPRNRRQPGRPRLPWTAARTTGCYGSVRPASRSDYSTTQLLCRTVTMTMSVASLLGNNCSRRSPTLSHTQLTHPAPPPCSWSLLG